MDYQNLIGFLLPPVIDLVNSKVTNSKARFWVAFLICLGVGTVLNLETLLKGDVANLAGNVAIVFTTAQVTYKTYWEKSSAREELKSRLP